MKQLNNSNWTIAYFKTNLPRLEVFVLKINILFVSVKYKLLIVKIYINTLFRFCIKLFIQQISTVYLLFNFLMKLMRGFLVLNSQPFCLHCPVLNPFNIREKPN